MKKIHPLRLLIKAIFIFIFANLIFAFFDPPIERLSIYNNILPGRTRFPFPEVDHRAVAIDNIDVLFASHKISAPKGENEFRVVLIGDSSIWGDFIESDQTLSARLNHLQLMCSGKDVKFYNIGFPHLSIAKDVLFLNKAMEFEPDAVIWSFTLRTLLPKSPNPFLVANSEQLYSLTTQYDLEYPNEELYLEEKTFFEKTIIGQRNELARILKLQIVGVVWRSTNSDASPLFFHPDAPPFKYPEDSNDLIESISFLDFDEPDKITSSIWLEYFDAGDIIAADVPVLLVNQPMFIASGENSHLRYNKSYPQWAYDQYRQILKRRTTKKAWRYLDLWDAIPPDYFIGDVFHLSPDGEKLLAKTLEPEFSKAFCEE